MFSMWEEIAAELHYSVRTLQRLHVKALEEVQGILDKYDCSVSQACTAN